MKLKIMSYLADITRFYAASQHLRSSNRNLLQKDHTNLVFTDHSFSQAAPKVWKIYHSTPFQTFPV